MVDWKRLEKLKKAEQGYCPKCGKKNTTELYGTGMIGGIKKWMCIKCRIFWKVSVQRDIFFMTDDEKRFKKETTLFSKTEMKNLIKKSAPQYHIIKSENP